MLIIVVVDLVYAPERNDTPHVGAIESLVMITTTDPEETLPAASTAIAVNVFVHSANGTRIPKVPFDNQVATSVAQL